MKSTQKEQALERLAAIETEAKQLRAIIEEPQQRTPEDGDVWEGASGSSWLVGVSKTTLLFDTEGTHPVGYHMLSRLSAEGATYLGKFDEVYCKRDDFIADVIEALSIEDQDGDSIMSSKHAMGYVCRDALEGSRHALAKLGIIQE